MSLNVKRNNKYAKLPSRADAMSAGYDLYSVEDITVQSHSWSLVDIGISIEMPDGVYGRIAPRSGLSLKGLCIGAGVIDRSYTGNIKVVIYNHADTDYQISINDRIAQLILEQIKTPEVVEVFEIHNTERGAGGFGSSGI